MPRWQGTCITLTGMRRSPILRAKDNSQGNVPSPSPDDQQAVSATWQTPYPWLVWLRTWSPGIVPPLFGLLLVLVATLLPGSQFGQPALPVPVLLDRKSTR